MVLEMDYNQVLEHVQMNNIVLAAAGDGVISGLDVTEKGTPDMSVDVAAGSCKIGGTKYTESGTVNLAISAADATHARKDLVIYDVATTNPLVITGTPATPPVPLDITSGDILLAIVDVAANETTITNTEITDCIVEITKLDELAAPSDNTNLNASTSVHGLLKKLPNNSAQYLNGVGTWATPAGAGDMSKSVYDPNDDGIIAVAQTEANNYSHPSARQCSSGDWAWASISGKPSTYPPSAHNQSATTITTGTLAVTRGGTGVTGDSYDADKVDGCDAGTTAGDVYKIPSLIKGNLLVGAAGAIAVKTAGTDGYQLTTHGYNLDMTWSAKSDLIFSDTHCPKCGQEFQDGDDLILHVIGHNEVGDILTLPMHISCVNEPKKTVTLKRKVFEDNYILDEMTGELKVQRVQKIAEKTITKHKLKEGYILHPKTGKAHTVDESGEHGNIGINLADAIEEIEETIEEVVYEDVNYEL